MYAFLKARMASSSVGQVWCLAVPAFFLRGQISINLVIANPANGLLCTPLIHGTEFLLTSFMVLLAMLLHVFHSVHHVRRMAPHILACTAPSLQNLFSVTPRQSPLGDGTDTTSSGQEHGPRVQDLCHTPSDNWTSHEPTCWSSGGNQSRGLWHWRSMP